MKKVLRIILPVSLILILVLYLGLNYAIKNVLAYSAIRPYRITQEKILLNYPTLINPSKIGLEYSDYNITVEDTILLKGWFIFSKIKPASGTIFLLHGIGSCKNLMLYMAKMLSEEGFNSVIYDSRANGESGGLNCTFGFYEKKDLSKFIDSTIIYFPDSEPYGVFGNSLGAAVAIQTMAEDKRLKCGIVESPFASLRETIRDYFAKQFILRINFIPDEALEYAEEIALFKVDSVQPARAAKMITNPTMIVHGLEDKHISPTDGKLVFNNLLTAEKIWYPIKGGNHNNLSKIGGSKYKRKILEFYKKYLVK